MMGTHRYDRGLAFLEGVSSADLDDLVACLVFDQSGKVRITESLTTSDRYQAHFPDHKMYLGEIVEEIQSLGLTELTTMLRSGECPLYRDVLVGVCDKLGVRHKKRLRAPALESALLLRMLEGALSFMGSTQIRELATSMGLKRRCVANAGAMLPVMETVLREGRVPGHRLATMVALGVWRAVHGRKLSPEEDNEVALSELVEPVGRVVRGEWVTPDISGPAYRIVVPVAVRLAAIRRKYQAKERA